MAEFNPIGPAPQDPNYNNLPRGTDRPQANQAFGALFEGVGNTIKIEAAAQQEQQQKQIQDSIYKGYDQTTDEVALAQMERANAGQQNFYQTQNPAVDNAIGSLEKLSAARAAGKVTDTYYWSQLNTMTKGLRSKYPGQREYIDKEVSRITGGTPANQLRNELNQEAAKLASASEASRSKQDTFVNQNLDVISADLLTAYQQGNPNAYTMIQRQVNLRKGQDHEIAAAKNQLELDASMGKANEANAVQVASRALNNKMNVFVADKTAKSGFANLRDNAMKQVASGKAPTPEEQQAFISQYAVAEAQALQVAQQTLYQPDPTTGKALADYLGPEKAKQMEEQAMFPVRQIKQLILNGEYGLVSMATNQAKASQDARVEDIKKNYPALQIISDFQKVGGNELVASALANDGNKLLSDQMRAVIELQAANSATAGDKSLDEYQKELKKLDPKDSNAFMSSITGHTNMLLDKNTRPDVAEKIANSMFGDKNSEFIQRFRTTGDKLNVFSKVSSPAVTAKMLELAKNNPATFANYARWSQDAFLAVFGGAIDGTKEGAANAPYTEVKFDPTNVKFSWNVTEQGKEAQKSIGGFLGGNAVQSWQNKALDDSIRQINQGIALIKPILEAQGADVTQEISYLLKNKGVDASAAKENSFFSKLYKAAGAMGDSAAKNLSEPGSGGSPFASFLGAWSANRADEEPQMLGGLNWDGRKQDDVKGIIIHHTGGTGSPSGVISTLNQRGLGVQYVMDRDGKVFQLGEDGARMAHMKPAQNGSGLSNENAIGIEIIAKDDSDITDAQRQAAVRWIARMRDKYPNIGKNVFGHGEVNPHKQATEGSTVVSAFRSETE